MPGSDAQLVRDTLKGSNSAFDELVERYRGRVIRAARSRVGIRDEAVDIAQEAFVRAYMSLHTLRDPDQFAPWLMVIAGNLCKMRLRGTREAIVPLEFVESAGVTVTDRDSAGVRDALDSLPAGTRAAAKLFFLDGLAQSDIAARLGISIPAVKARIRHAKTRLREEMTDMVERTAKKDESGAEFASDLKYKLELARWFRTIADHCGSGGDMMTGLQAIRKADYSAPLLEATDRMIEAVRTGRSVTDAMAGIPALASPEALGMVRAGELFGSLHVAGRILADWLEVQGAQRRIELAFWCRTFGFLLSAGAPMTETLSHGVDIAHSKALQHATREMIQALNELGDRQPTDSPLRPVLDRYPDVFPPLLKVAVVAGERLGKLDLALFWAADEMSDDLALDIASGLLGENRELTPRLPSIIVTEKLLPAPCIELLSDSAPDIRAAAIDALGRLDWKDAAHEVAELLADDSACVREAAARVVARLGYKDAQDSLVRCLRDDDPVVRRTAIESLVALDLHDSAQALAEAIRDTDHRVIMAAIESLVDLHETEVMKQKALKMLQSEVWEDQKRAAYLLRYFLPQDVVEGLIDALPGDLSLQQMNAVIALGLYGCVQARAILNRIVRNPEVSELAARALRDIGDASSAAAIRSAIKAGTLDPRFSETADAMDER